MAIERTEINGDFSALKTALETLVPAFFASVELTDASTITCKDADENTLLVFAVSGNTHLPRAYRSADNYLTPITAGMSYLGAIKYFFKVGANGAFLTYPNGDALAIAKAENGKTAIQKSIALKPDVIVMDLVMPNMDGTAATTEILKCLPETKILMLTSFGTADGIAHAIEAGAKGAMMKNADFSELVAAIRTIPAGGRAISPEIEHFMEEDPPVQKLTQRQSDILASLVRGLTNDDIAKQFSIQRSSVKDHLTAIFEKLGAANRSEAVSIALRKHLLKT